MDKWGFCYVENLTWVHMAPNNTVVAAPSLYARRSHLSLFIFRKSGAPSAMRANLMLPKHNRNTDEVPSTGDTLIDGGGQLSAAARS